jgi:hypothetical protein
MVRVAASALALSSLAASAAGADLQISAAANPVRKVVNLLQAMQVKVEKEGDKEAELYKQFMCYCKSGGKDLQASIAAAETKIGDLASDIKEAAADLDGTQEQLAEDKKDRAAGQKAMDEATALRKKEKAAYAKFKAESDANRAAIKKAVAALEKGMGGSFLQTNSAKVLRELVSSVNVGDDDKELLLSFLSAPSWGAGYSAQSGQITGILKQMGDEMSAEYKEATDTEQKAIQEYEQLMDTRLKEKATLTKAIESLLEKEAELKVSLAEMKNDNEDTVEALAADKKFLANLGESCATKTQEWEERSKTRKQELLALADTIKILNSDDSLELFKKTLPSAAASFMQVQMTEGAQRAAAVRALNAVVRSVPAVQRARLDLISLALHGKKVGFEKVIGMIDELVSTLKKEQVDDQHKKEYCSAELDSRDDKKKDLERDISDLGKSIATAEEAIATLKAESADLKVGIVKLDKSVAEATADRKAEHEEYEDLIASDSAAKKVLGLAKNRLNQFYNPKLAKSAPAFLQVVAHVQRSQDAPPPPPETFGAYSTKTEENGSVLSMITLLETDLDKEMAAAEAEEKNAQESYTTLMKDSAEKRTADSKSLTEKTSALADTEKALEDHTEDKSAASKELGATLKVISELHAECDWLLKYFDVRAEARASEIDALGSAKAVLNGADYSF